MKSDIPKPFLSLKGKPILDYTVACFSGIPEVQRIIIPVHPDFLNKTKGLLAHFQDTVEIQCIEGGQERQYSIMNAIQFLGDIDLVSVHDAVRPFVDRKSILESFRIASEKGAAVVGIKARDTIKRTDSYGTVRETLDRSVIWQCQTPQTFRRELFISAYKKAREKHFLGTDDASVIEYYGEEVHMVEGNQQNIKLTYPFDLQLAEFIIEKSKESGAKL